MTEPSTKGLKDAPTTRSLGLIARDLRGLLTPLTRPFDLIDAMTLAILLSELEALEATDAKRDASDALKALRTDVQFWRDFTPRMTTKEAFQAVLNRIDALDATTPERIRRRGLPEQTQSRRKGVVA
jgi:hypothetical protein